jgi:Co/Zn/Cd efflux system component
VSSNVVRWGGLAGLVAAVMWVLTAIFIILLATPQRVSFNSFSDYLPQIVLLVAYGGTLVALLGLHALHSGSGRYGRLGAAGSLLTFIGYAIVFVVIIVSILEGGASLLPVRLAAATAVLIGSILLGAMVIRARIIPWWCGMVLIVAFPLGNVSNAVLEGSEGILLGILWGLVGFALLSQSGTVAEQPSRVS